MMQKDPITPLSHRIISTYQLVANALYSDLLMGGADWLGVVTGGGTEDQVVEVRLDVALRQGVRARRDSPSGLSVPSKEP